MDARPFRSALSAAAAALLLTGCSALGIPSEAPRGADGQVVEAAEADAETMKVGDCLDEPGEEEFQSFQAKPCSEPHQLEVYHSFAIGQGSYPADDDAWMSLTEACLPPFEEFTGAAYEDASLELFPITPTRESWALGDRTVSCLVGDPLLEPVTGSLAGKG